MPNLKPTIKSNKVQCNKCGDIIESVHRHDFRYCKCKHVYVDGGRDYIRRGYDGPVGDFKELSEFKPAKQEE